MISLHQYRMAVGLWNNHCHSRPLRAKEFRQLCVMCVLLSEAQYRLGTIAGISCRVLMGLSYQHMLLLCVLLYIINYNQTKRCILMCPNIAPIYSLALAISVACVTLSARLLEYFNLLLLMAGDIHSNPGPVDGNLFMCHLNTRSIISESDSPSDNIPYRD